MGTSMKDKCPGTGCPPREYCKRHDPDGKILPLFDELNLTCEMLDPDMMKELE